MMHILLTVAGFSHNWGGYLAKEAFDYLLGVTEHDKDLRSLLWIERFFKDGRMAFTYQIPPF